MMRNRGYRRLAAGMLAVMLMCIGRESEQTRGTYAYLTLMLSDTLQTQKAMTEFPVIR